MRSITIRLRIATLKEEVTVAEQDRHGWRLNPSIQAPPGPRPASSPASPRSLERHLAASRHSACAGLEPKRFPLRALM